MSDEVKESPLDSPDGCPRRPRQADGIADDRVKHRLRVGGRLADHAKNLGGRRLLFEGLGQLSVARLKLIAAKIICQ